MKHRWLLVAFILTLVGLPWQSVSADDGPAGYVVGVENEDYFPHYRYLDGRYSGYGRDLLDAFAQWAGVTLQYRGMPVNRLFDALLSGEVDLKYPANPAWHRRQKDDVSVAYSQPVVTYVEGLMVPPQRRGAGLAAVKRISILRGFTPTGYEAQRNAGTVEFLAFDTTADVLRAALDDRSDAAYVERSVGEYILREVLKQPGALVFDTSVPSTRADFLLASTRHPELMRLFDRFLNAQRAEVEKIRKHYRLDY